MYEGVTRMQAFAMRIIVLATLSVLAAPAFANLTFRYADEFSEAEKAKLTTWINEVDAAIEQLVGPYPFPIRITFKRTHSEEPVPWANTQRGRTQGIQFYVNPEFSLEALRADWTAAHELSHLILPFVGRRNAWFAEGFASFMQYQVMHAMGILTADAVQERYLMKLRASRQDYPWDDLRFVDTTPQLRERRQYPVMYWGGAVFFFRMNEAQIAADQPDIVQLLSQYMDCCRRNRASLSELTNDLDNILGSSLVSDEFERFISVVGFPDFERLDIGVIARKPKP